MGETATLERPDRDTTYFPPATFEESVLETSPEIEVAKNEIERTRSEMSATVDAIKAQLSPERLVADAKEAVTEAAKEKVEDVKEAIKEKVSDVVHGASEMASNVAATVSDIASSIGEKASSFTDNAKENSNAALIAAGSTAVVAAGVAGAKMKETGDLLMETIRENPVPTALIGVGLGWLLVDAAMKQQKRHALASNTINSYGDKGYGTYPANNFAVADNSPKNGLSIMADQASDKLHETGEKIGDAISDAKAKVADTAHDLQDKASDLADTAKEKVSNFADSAKEKVSDFADTAKTKTTETVQLVQTKASDFGHAAQTTAKTAVHTTQDFITENPLAAGAVALLVGAAVGLAFPSTPVENRYLGDHRDRLADQANEKAQELLGKVQHVAGEAMEVAKSSLAEAKDHVQETLQTQVHEQGLVPA